MAQTNPTSSETRMQFLPRLSSSGKARVIVTLGALILGALCYALRPLPIPQLPHDARVLEFVDRNGLPLGTILGRGERRTLAVPLERVAPTFVQAVLAAEDARFFTHGAVDWAAAARAVWRAGSTHAIPGGASTISMQVARLIEPVGSGWRGKLRELVLARRLENGSGKREILEAYCNLAPMGSNVQGVEAAARTYFNIPAAELDLAQAALLAALPNDPVRLDPYRGRPALELRRRYILARMVALGYLDPAVANRAAHETVALQARNAGILAAPHFLFHLAPRVPDGVARVRTTLDRPLQEFVAAQVRDVVAELHNASVRHGAALVLDNRTGEVLAYAGSPNYFADDDLGRNDGVQALRQPGSALKPFLYELALERRTLRPDSILADVPATYALPGARSYQPVDYSNRFLGPVRVRLALADSLNVPAVHVLASVGVETFRQRLLALGFAHLTKSADFYGLGLTLGGGEVTLAELARAYLTAARGGVPTALVETLDPPGAAAGTGPPREPDAPPLDPAWPLVSDMLADAHARAAAFGVDSVLRLPFAAAVKTGTSSDYRDTWTAGYTRDYTVAVWVGNFDGAPMRGISGVTGAAPIWSRIMLHLYDGRPEPLAFAPPPGYLRRTFCATSGAPPSPDCGPLAREWFDRSDLIRRERLAPHVRLAREYDDWLARQPARAALPTRILFPADGATFIFDPAAPPGERRAERLSFEFAGPRDARLTVTLDGRRLAARDGDYLWPLALGRHVLEARSPSGTSRVSFDVTRDPLRHHIGFTLGASDATSASRARSW
jgi:penicillin-binding protein 1C